MVDLREGMLDPEQREQREQREQTYLHYLNVYGCQTWQGGELP